MIASLSLILFCQLGGEVIVRGLNLPMPGPVLGLVFLLILLLTRDRFSALRRGPLRNDAVESTARGLLSHLSLLFIPAGVGVVKNLDLVIGHGIAILLTLAASVVVTLFATVATFLAINRLLTKRQVEP
ncbi:MULTISPECIES: CidA/LrgA family protein [unclassified Bradyrhizobium]|uniref:CidA/LrgA family protein n=1 Tax=unclassified Bradyrhizobium TaxID=2631580 RepID=UPI00088C18D3|nr:MULTISPECIES: CidA/LrgA family protein [unclassified Bradyrhizobium]SDG72854.1 Putative effector of murein hydrolase LrgA, UPF0299 family [Bradyrhizobium sp. Rc2d]SFI12298.1 Putative effector of murein hydrolase LrgA, UPF0299 family [Bradyrhizobium sp. Gha]